MGRERDLSTLYRRNAHLLPRRHGGSSDGVSQAGCLEGAAGPVLGLPLLL